MAAQPSSGTYAFQPAASDLVLDAYARIQIRPTELTPDHLYQARLSSNLLLADWAVRGGPNLWKVELLSTPMTQGVPTYSVPGNVVAILDYYIRQYQIGNPVNLGNAFSTTANSTLVKVTQPNHGLIPGNWIGLTIQVAVGGLLLYGFYEVTSVVDINNYNITAASAAASTVVNGGVVPIFTMYPNETGVTVTLPNHGYLPNENFPVPVPVTVSGVTLSGAYQITSVPNPNVLMFTAQAPGGSTQSVPVNTGLAQIEPQLPNSQPQDRVIFPISRTEYSAQPDKFTEAYPTTVWWDRTLSSTLTFWPVPDQNGPYVLFYYAMTQIQDAVLPQGITMDLPYRFLKAFADGLAADLAVKYPPPMPGLADKLDVLAQRSWANASQQDTENVPLWISPGLTGYFR